jgi:hypothetical protein
MISLLPATFDSSRRRVRMRRFLRFSAKSCGSQSSAREAVGLASKMRVMKQNHTFYAPPLLFRSPALRASLLLPALAEQDCCRLDSKGCDVLMETFAAHEECTRSAAARRAAAARPSHVLRAVALRSGLRRMCVAACALTQQWAY